MYKVYISRMSRCNPNPRYILNQNSNIVNGINGNNQLNSVYISSIYGLRLINVPANVYNKTINIPNAVNCNPDIASVYLVKLPPIPQICPVTKIKKAFFLNSVYKRCLKVHYSQFVTQGNDPNVSNATRISQILSSGSLGGKVVFVTNGGISGQREGQPGGIVPPLRNRF